MLRDPFLAKHQPMASHASSPRSCGFGRAFLILALGASVHCGKADAETTKTPETTDAKTTTTPTTTPKPAAGKTGPGKPRDEAKKKKDNAPAPAERKPQPHVAPPHAPPSHVAPREPKDEAARVQGAPPKTRLPVPPPPDTSAPPPRLPPASREKMHACADEWAKLKLETRGPLPLWRAFAGECLTRGKANSNQ